MIVWRRSAKRSADVDSATATIALIVHWKGRVKSLDQGDGAGATARDFRLGSDREEDQADERSVNRREELRVRGEQAAERERKRHRPLTKWLIGQYPLGQVRHHRLHPPRTAGRASG